MPNVVIVGGGLAGLAAAASLGERGVPTTLIESRPRLGGRASSFVDQSTGETIDNCQHVAMGCCTSFAHFCRTVGIAELFRVESTLYFIAPDGTACRFEASGWPAPLHLARALGRLSYLSARDRIGIARGLRALARYRRTIPDGRSFADWLRDHDQTPTAIERFWHVVLVSALSESLDRIDVGYARKVFVDGFLANRAGWEVHVPRVPLDELYGPRLTGWLESRGVSVRLRTGAVRIECEGNRALAVALRDGGRLGADHVVVAVPHTHVLSLLPQGWRDHPEVARVERIESSPISSVHLWFDRAITELPHAVLVDRLSQWVFRRETDAGGERGAERSPGGSNCTEGGERHYYQVVISASRPIEGRPANWVIADVVRELVDLWPAAARARVLHARLVTERRAAFSPVPGVDRLRPRQQSPIANLQLAGDWTRTGWPATMEGAVRSGFLAAQNVLHAMGRRESLVPPDLPVGRLSRILLGL